MLISGLVGAGLSVIGGIADSHSKKKAAEERYDLEKAKYRDNVRITSDKFYEQLEQLKLVYDGNVDASNILKVSNYTSTQALIAAQSATTNDRIQSNIETSMRQIALNNDMTIAKTQANNEAVSKTMSLLVDITNEKIKNIEQSTTGKISAAKDAFETTDKVNTILASTKMEDAINKSSYEALEKGIQGQKKLGALASKGEGITAGTSRARELVEAQIAITKDMQQSRDKGESMIDQIASDRMRKTISDYASTREKQKSLGISGNSQVAMALLGTKESLGRLGIGADNTAMLADISNYTNNMMTTLSTDKANANLNYSTTLANAKAILSAERTQSSIDAGETKLAAGYNADMMRELHIPPFRGVAPDTSWSFNDTLGVVSGAIGGYNAFSSLGTLTADDIFS
jgi:hypothetical protein